MSDPASERHGPAHAQRVLGPHVHGGERDPPKDERRPGPPQPGLGHRRHEAKRGGVGESGQVWRSLVPQGGDAVPWREIPVNAFRLLGTCDDLRVTLVFPGLLLIGVSIAAGSALPGLDYPIFYVGLAVILLGLAFRAKHPITEPLPSMGWPQWGRKLRRKPTERERAFGWAGSIISVAVGVLVFVTTGMISDFGALAIFFVFILWLWGHVAGFSMALETWGPPAPAGGTPSPVRAKKVPKVK